jgi:hypothetical protein
VIIRKAPPPEPPIGAVRDRVRFAWLPLRLTSGAWVWLEGVRERWVYRNNAVVSEFAWLPDWRLTERQQIGGAW